MEIRKSGRLQDPCGRSNCGDLDNTEEGEKEVELKSLLTVEELKLA